MEPINPILASNLQAMRTSGYPVPPDPHMPAGWELDTANAEISLRVPGPEGTLIAAHSRRNPRAEAERLVADAGLTADHSVALLAGAGLGFAADAVADQRPDLPIVISDTTFDRLVPFLCRRDWSRQIADGRIGLFWPDAGTDSRTLRRMLEARDDEAMLVVRHPVLARVNGANGSHLPATIAAFQRFWTGARANRTARLQFEGPYADNTLANLSRLDGMFDIRRLAGRCAKRPTLVIAAGPSLDEQLRDIREWRARGSANATIVSVDTALRPLLAAGIDPDFVVAVDPSELNSRHLLDLASQTQARLVGELSLPPTLFDAFNWRAIPFRVGLNEPWPWLVKHVADLGILAAWGSVLVTAIDFACHLGGDPVLLCAADLAYTGNRPYCRGTTFGRNAAEKGESEEELAARWMTLVEDRLVTLDDIHGNPTRVPSHFPTIRDAIVNLAGRRPDHRVVNTTGAGILAGGRIEQGTLRDLLKRDPEKRDLLKTAPPRAQDPLRATPDRHGTTDRRATDDRRATATTADADRDPRIATGLRTGDYESHPEWLLLGQNLVRAWPQITGSAVASMIALMRALAVAERCPGNGVPLSADACVRWIAPFVDTPWTPAMLRVVQSIDTVLPRWYEDLDPTLAQAFADRQLEPSTYAHIALWVTRSTGDRLHLSPAIEFINRVADRLFDAHVDGSLQLPPDTRADLVLLTLLGRRRSLADVETLLNEVRDQLPNRPIVTEALQALWARSRAEALIAGTPRLAPAVMDAAARWTALERRDGRDTQVIAHLLVLIALTTGQSELADRYLREGLTRHPALADACPALALESWFSHEEAMAHRLLEIANPTASPAATAPMLYQFATAQALLGDPDRAREHFVRLQAAAPWFFGMTFSPNSRWFYATRAATALGDQTFAARAERAMRRWDPFAHQREAVAPKASPPRVRAETATPPATRTSAHVRPAATTPFPAFDLPSS